VEPAVEHEQDGALEDGMKQWNWFSLAALSVFAEVHLQI